MTIIIPQNSQESLHYGKKTHNPVTKLGYMKDLQECLHLNLNMLIGLDFNHEKVG